jgi:hypothetical protein
MPNQDTLRIPVRVSYGGALEGLPTKRGFSSGEDLPALVRNAAKFASVKIDDLFFNVKAAQESDGAYVHAWTDTGDDHVNVDIGPMAGIAQPSILSSELGYPWRVFWSHIEHQTNEYRHLAEVVVTNRDQPPRQRKDESDEAFKTRLNEFHEEAVAISSRSGWHVVEYPVQPRYWSAADLEHVIAKFLSLVPIDSFWRVTLEQARWRHRNLNAPRWQWVLRIGTYRYTASLRLPIFPASALVDWLSEQEAEVAFKPNLQRLQILADAPDPDVRTRPASRPVDDVGFKPMVVQGGHAMTLITKKEGHDEVHR